MFNSCCYLEQNMQETFSVKTSCLQLPLYVQETTVVIHIFSRILTHIFAQQIIGKGTTVGQRLGSVQLLLTVI